MYRQRAAASSGLAVGSLALPWLFAGLADRQSVAELPAAGAAAGLHTCLAASAVATLLFRRSRDIAEQPRGQIQRKRAEATESRSLPLQNSSWWARWAVPAALAAVALQAAAAEAALGIVQASMLAASAAAACACLHALLAGLPGTFTIGEALVAAQAAALLGSAALQQLLSPLLRSGSASQADQAMETTAPCQRFVLLLTAGSVLGTAVLFPLLLALRQQAKGLKPGPATRQRGANGSYQLPGLPVTAAAAAAVAAAAAAAAAPAALWALRYALATRRRLLLLCWWAAALAAALPAMGWLNASGRVPSILGGHLGMALETGAPVPLVTTPWPRCCELPAPPGPVHMVLIAPLCGA